MSNAQVQEIIRIEKLAEEEGIPIATLRSWRATKSPLGPPSGKLAGHVVYRRRDIEAWKESAFAN